MSFSDECWVALTSNTINFSKAYLTFLDDALKLPSADSNIFVDEILHDIFQAQLKHVENSLRSGKYKGEVMNGNVGFRFFYSAFSISGKVYSQKCLIFTAYRPVASPTTRRRSAAPSKPFYREITNRIRMASQRQ